MRRQKKFSWKEAYKTLGVCLVISFLFIGFFIFGYKFESYQSSIVPQRMDPQEYSACFNQTLLNTSLCMREFVGFIYNYTVFTPDTIRPINDIAKNGGDCYDYGKIYEEMAYNLGFSAKGVKLFHRDSEQGHYVIIIFNEEGYCHLDQLATPVCAYYSQVNQDE